MKKHFLQLLVLLFLACTFSIKAQVVVIDNFDNAIKDSLYQNNLESPSTMVQTLNTTDKKEGTASLGLKAVIGNIHSWGSYAQLIRPRKAGAPFFNWEGSDSLSLWIKVVKAPAKPQNVVFRIHIGERQDTAGNMEEYIYENATILDSAKGWVNLKVPLKEIDSKGATVNPGDSGFVIVPANWNPPPRNDMKLDLTHISQYNISVITTAAEADSIEVLYDNFARTGSKSIPFVVFNGKVVSGEMKIGAWGAGGAAVSVVPNMGSAAGKSAIEWKADPNWGDANGGWTGWYVDFPEKNMAGNFKNNDTMKIKVKIPAEFNDDLRIQFGSPSATGKDGKGLSKHIFKKADYNWDGTWKTLKFTLQGGVPDGGNIGFDSSRVNKFEVMGETGKTKASTLYFDDIWVGSPAFDVIPPVAPAKFTVTKLTGLYDNAITWTDVPNEPNAQYDVYYSPKPITDLKSKDIEVLKAGIVPGVQSADHVLRAPVSDQDVTFYYGITCTDASGNVGPIAQAGPVVNKAKGVPTISLTVPAFRADGSLKEWTDAGIKPIAMKMSDGSGTLVTNQKIDNDADLSVLSYLAVDKDYLYVAFDITDDVVAAGKEAAADSWLRDCPDLFLGLYNYHGATHSAYLRGNTPDYHFRFNNDRVIFDNPGSDSLLMAGTNYKFQEKLSGGYTIEAKISLSDIAKKRTGGFTGTDQVFVPVDGMRIPIDFSVNDNDGTGREGILTYSPANQDQSWGDFSRWTYTWVGTKMYVTGVQITNEGPVSDYALSQNYPNPFNPTTTIKYSIAKPGMVSLKIYDVVGREVATLVNQEQGTGSYQVTFDASRLSSGLYLYRIQAGDFSAVNKMMLIK